MAYYQDLSPYVYSSYSSAKETVNVGWLGGGHSYPTGAVSDEFLDRLIRLTTRFVVNRMRGWEDCPFCDGEYPIKVEVDGKEVALGDAEIRVAGSDGRNYAAPTLISHYVLVHNYRPPQEFVKAVMADERV